MANLTNDTEKALSTAVAILNKKLDGYKAAQDRNYEQLASAEIEDVKGIVSTLLSVYSYIRPSDY